MSISDNELSERELEILRLISTGVSNKQIAQDLHISVNTVKVHLRNIFAKINVTSRTEAAMYAVNAGLVDQVALRSPELVAVEAEEELAADQNAAAPLDAAPAPRRNYRLIAVMGLVILVAVALRLYTTGALPFDAAPGTAANPVLPDSQRQTWQSLAPMPTARYGLAAAVEQDLIYAAGGYTPSGPTGALERYSLSANEWVALKPKPTPVYEIGAVWMAGKIYIPGGRISEDEVSDGLEIYDPATDTWAAGASLPEPRCAYALTLFEGQMYLFGGWDGRSFRNTIYAYSPAEDRWKTAGKLPSPRGYAGATSLSGRILVVGGYDGRRALADVLTFQPAISPGGQPDVHPLRPLPAARYGMGVTSIADVLFVVGGRDATGQVQSSLQYYGLSDEWQAFLEPGEGPWTDLAVAPHSVSLYALGGRLNGQPVNEFRSYQAFYTLVIPVVK